LGRIERRDCGERLIIGVALLIALLHLGDVGLHAN